MSRRKIRFELEYDGTAYHGWQRQKGLLTIQQVVEETLQRITQESPVVMGASRTDSGVHALQQVAHFWTSRPLPDETLQKALNATLPKDIVVKKLETTQDTFHAMQHAHSKLYRYQIENLPFATPLKRLTHWWVPSILNVEAMQEAGKIFIGTRDFRAFKTSGNNPKSTVRTIFNCEVQKSNKVITILIHGDGFLKQMVRGIVGTLVMVGKGQLSLPEVKTILESHDRRKAGNNAPPHGLCLVSVFYDDPRTNTR